MISKKINQLATELAPDLSDLTIIGDPTTGISKKITLSQMASLFTGTVEEYANLAAFPLVGVADTIYVAKDTNVIYRWDSTAYVVLSPNVIASLVFNDANGFDGTIALVGSVATLTITTALTTGSVPFIGASGALTQDNSNLFFDDTNNRLGIATASPTTPLDVFGSGIIGRLNATSTNNAYLGFASNGTNKWSAGNVQSDHRFRIFSEANSTELISVLQTGEFGIGISNPTTKFHIDGAASALIANLDANVSVAKTLSFRSDNSNRINLEVSGTESGSNAGANFFLRTYTDAGSLLETPLSIVRSTGVTTIKSLTLTNVLSVGNGGTGASSFTSGSILFSNGTLITQDNANLFFDDTNNRLGIGTAVPAYTLDVSGTGRFTGALTGAAASFSGMITSTVGNNAKIFDSASATTGYQYFQMSNSVGTMVLGVDNNAGTGLAINSLANAVVLNNSANAPLILGTNNTTRMTITSAGNVGIGTSSPSEVLQVSGNIRGSNRLYLNDGTNTLEFGTNYIQAYLNSGAASTNLLFYTGTSERMRITSGGEVLMNTTSVLSAGWLCISVASNNYNAIVCRDTGTTYSTGNYYQIFTNSSNGLAGGITHPTASTVGFYTGPSDQRLKSNIKDVEEPVLPLFNNAKLKTYNHIADEDESVVYKGFLAQDMVDNFPEAYGKDKDGYYMYNPTGYIPYLVKAIQEMNTKLDAQNQTIQSLQEQINILSK